VAVWEFRDFDWERTSVMGWLYLLWWGAGTLGLGSALWYAGVAKAEASVAAAFMDLMPVSALVLSYVLLGEEFRWAHLAGFAGVLLITRTHAAASE
jgi:drug/metabolite transporter (DMT)-like permease